MSKSAANIAGVAVFVVLGMIAIERGAELATAEPSESELEERDEGDCPKKVDGWDSEQVEHATTITRVAEDMGMSHHAVVVALATVMQESNITNHGHLGPDNDHDSLGLFQQRPSQGWGEPEEVTNPEYAATKFFEKLKTIDGWEAMEITDAAQAVQVSAHPTRYQRHAKKAKRLEKALRGCR